MKKIALIFSLLLVTLTSGAQFSTMGYYPNTAYGDYVIVYGYYQADGTFALSHCRTNVISTDVYSNKYYLDVNTCTFKPRVLTDTSTIPVTP